MEMVDVRSWLTTPMERAGSIEVGVGGISATASDALTLGAHLFEALPASMR